MTPAKQLADALALMSDENLPKNKVKRQKLICARNSLADLMGRLTELELIAESVIAIEDSSRLLVQRICP